MGDRAARGRGEATLSPAAAIRVFDLRWFERDVPLTAWWQERAPLRPRPRRARLVRASGEVRR